VNDVRFHVARLALTDFRSHENLELTLDAQPVCLFGPNGAGKTNILESLATLASGRGLRGASVVDMARQAPNLETRPRLWSVSARMCKDGEAFMLGAGAERAADGAIKRLARLDGRAASASELAQAARMTWLTPAMDRLFSGPAGDRRRFLDRLALGAAPEHGAAAIAYERALRERQRLLNENRFDAAWLNALEREMAAHGAALAYARMEVVSLLRASIATRADGAFPKAVIALDGALEAAFGNGDQSADIEEWFMQTLLKTRRRDAAAGRTLDGPHRSDLLVRHAGKDMPAELCSTGEQKALLLGLVLAHARALADAPGVGPALVLLDEAAAHLDPDRRAALYDELLALPGQAWLTSTEAALFEAFGDRAQRVRVG
jgi:DNA replication and repair protein RecF